MRTSMYNDNAIIGLICLNSIESIRYWNKLFTC